MADQLNREFVVVLIVVYHRFAMVNMAQIKCEYFLMILMETR